MLQSIAGNYGATVEQVILAFEFAKGYCAIPTSGRSERIRSNFEATKLTLQSKEITLIEALDKNSRMIDPDWGPKWD